jgi:hypothetical protein
LEDIGHGAPKGANQDLRSPEAIFASYRALQDRSAEMLQVQSALAERDALAQEKTELATKLGVETQAGKDSKQRLEASIQQLTLLGSQLDEQKKLASKPPPPAENKAQADALQVAQRKCKEAEQEGELLLLQLHQVQEELENYFLQHQEAQKQLQAEKSRWQRMLKHTPDYCDFESIQLVSAQGDKGLETHWKLKGLDAGVRNFPELEFRVIIEQGVAGFVFTREGSASGPLLRWPQVAASQAKITVLPISAQDTAKERSEILRDLACSDLQLVTKLAQLLIKTLEGPTLDAAPVGFVSNELKPALNRFIELIEKYMVASLHYDHVRLKRGERNPNYEHLWFEMENVAISGKQWPSFEFRLACANVRPNQFGEHPKLEFPEASGRTQIEQWFAESSDNLGAKLELRFATPQSMDVSVWRRLSENDRRLIVGLLGILPSMLVNLEESGEKLFRPAQDWQDMVNEMKRILVQTIGASQKSRVLSAAPAPAPAVSDLIQITPPSTKKITLRAPRTSPIVKNPK